MENLHALVKFINLTPNFRLPRVTRAFNLVSDYLVDFYYGIETRKRVPLRRLRQLNSTVSFPYAPTPWLILRRIFKHMPVQPSDVFLDMGCGKGRALFAASFFPFHRIIGVELAEDLCKSAQDNINAFLGKSEGRAKKIEVICADAAKFRVPQEVTVLFMFDAFQGECFRSLVQNLKISLIEKPRPFHVIYVFPRLVFDLTKHFEFEEVCPSSKNLYCILRLLRTKE